MRFLGLLGKELRECLPWLLLMAIVLLALGGFVLRTVGYYGPYWDYRRLSPGSAVESYYRLTHPPPLRLTGAWVLVTSIGLGLVLGVRHFWIPNFTRTWPFLLHRSTGRMTILAAKLTAATIAFIISLGAVWVGLYWYACRPEFSPIPQTLRVFIEGWIFITLGLVAYLGTTLSGLSTAKWYATKIFGLVFATVVIFTTFSQWRLVSVFAVVIIGVAILLSQIIETFLNREF